VANERSLLDVLGHRPACVTGLCGACRVLVDGELVNACTTLAKDVRAGATIESYKDVAHEPATQEAVKAFLDARPTRCALCVPSIGVTAAGLARKGKSGDEAAIDAALETAACMCTGRRSLRAALLSVGKKP
jgi:aerobic carbon-monoxide dehydrogenase small subunit